MGCRTGNCGGNATKIAGKRQQPQTPSKPANTSKVPFTSTKSSTTVIRNGKVIQRP